MFKFKPIYCFFIKFIDMQTQDTLLHYHYTIQCISKKTETILYKNTFQKLGLGQWDCEQACTMPGP